MERRMVRDLAKAGNRFRLGTGMTLLAATLLPGCGRSERNDVTQLVSATASPTASPTDAPTDARDELVQAFEQAFRQRDLEKLKNLVWWEGADEFIRSSVEGSLEDDLRHQLLDVQLDPPTVGEVLEFTHQGLVYKPNLPVAGRLRVSYQMEGMTDPASSSYLVGQHEGRYFIAVAAPESKP